MSGLNPSQLNKSCDYAHQLSINCHFLFSTFSTATAKQFKGRTPLQSAGSRRVMNREEQQNTLVHVLRGRTSGVGTVAAVEACYPETSWVSIDIWCYSFDSERLFVADKSLCYWQQPCPFLTPETPAIGSHQCAWSRPRSIWFLSRHLIDNRGEELSAETTLRLQASTLLWFQSMGRDDSSVYCFLLEHCAVAVSALLEC